MHTGPQRYTPPRKMNLIHVHRYIEVRILTGLTDNPPSDSAIVIPTRIFPRYFGKKTVWSIESVTVCRSWRGAPYPIHTNWDYIA